MADVTVFLTTTGANVWTVPADWSSVNTIRCIGGGNAGGLHNTTCTSVTQASGGTYASVTNLTGLTANGSANYNVGSASTGDTWISNTGVAPTGTSEGALAKRSQSNTTGCIGTVTFAGGAPGTGSICGGAGGAASAGGRGGNGGNGAGGKSPLRGGGGGGAGDAAQGGDGSGATAGTGGSVGGGAGGAGGAGGGASGGDASNGTTFTATVGGATAGAGGGGGGGQGSGRRGGNGGLYGGGGGGCTFNPSCAAAGTGTQGIIIITYTAAAGVKRTWVWEF